jgi:hypothetical protein
MSGTSDRRQRRRAILVLFAAAALARHVRLHGCQQRPGHEGGRRRGAITGYDVTNVAYTRHGEPANIEACPSRSTLCKGPSGEARCREHDLHRLHEHGAATTEL